MTKVIGVRFRTAGKVYFFDPLAFEIKRGDHVIVETARGIEFGTVISGVHEVEDDKIIQPLKPVIRIATERDIEQEASNKIREKEAYRICLEKIRKHELEMKLIDAEYTFDNNKVLFYFTADGRIDFRELVKDLASVFKTRIELRQIGVRDETKIMGGIGICGRPLCCHSYLSDFVPVSIKMAKEQNLSLNPTKISGVCGRLMCCLKNEEETYEYLNRRLPGIGDYVTTDEGLKGEVQSVNVLRQIVKVVVENGDEKEIREYDVDRLQFKRRHGKKEKIELSKEELRELERLEKEELQEEMVKKAEIRSEEKPESRLEERSETRAENRGENRYERRNNRRNDRRSESANTAGSEVKESGEATAAQQESEKRVEGNGRNERRANRRSDRRNDNENAKRPDIQEKNPEKTTEKSIEKGSEDKEDNKDTRRNDRRNYRGDRRRENRGEGAQNRIADVNADKKTDKNADGFEESPQAGNAEENGGNRQGKRYDGRYRRRGRDRREGRKPENNDN